MTEQKDGAVGVLDAPTAVVPVKKPRKVRAPKHDFKDGLGKTFAHRHVNGNGWVADTAKVADSVFVNKLAAVYHSAIVAGLAKIEGRSQVCGFAQISDRVQLTSFAYASGKARISDDCKLMDDTRVTGGAISGSTVLHNKASIRGHAVVRNCTLYGTATISGHATVIGTSIENDAYIGGNANVCKSNIKGYVTVAGNAQVICSKLYQDCVYISGNALPEANRLKIIDFAIVANVDAISGLLVFGGHSMVVGGAINFRPQHSNGVYVRPVAQADAIFSAVSISRYDQFQAFNVPRSQQARVLNHAMPTTRPINMDALVPNRRLMSLEGAVS